MICDFCSSPDVRWIYPADSFDIRMKHEPTGGLFEARSELAWTACDECSTLIEDNDWVKLTKRSADKFCLMTGNPPEHIIQATTKFLAVVHREFRIHRRGERQILLLGTFNEQRARKETAAAE